MPEETVQLKSIYRHDREAELPMTVYIVAFGLGVAAVWKWWCGSSSSVKKDVRAVLGEEEYLAVRSGKSHSGVPGADLIRQAGAAEEELEKVRGTKYDSSNEDHEKLLERLWAALKPGVTRTARKTTEWEEIGFQGKDPATDFRGNGILGLLNLVYFAENHTDEARKMIDEGGWKPTQTESWYLFSVTGINLTSHITKLLKATQLDTQFGALPAPGSDAFFTPSVTVHCQLYASLMLSFHEHWIKHRPNVMEFNQFVDKHVYPANTGVSLKRA